MSTQQWTQVGLDVVDGWLTRFARGETVEVQASDIVKVRTALLAAAQGNDQGTTVEVPVGVVEAANRVFWEIVSIVADTVKQGRNCAEISIRTLAHWADLLSAMPSPSKPGEPVAT